MRKGEAIEITGVERRDEIGATARAVNEIKEMLADNARHVAEHKAEQDREATAEREADIARTGEFLAAVADIVAAGVAGDFTQRVDIDGKTGLLLNSALRSIRCVTTPARRRSNAPIAAIVLLACNLAH